MSYDNSDGPVQGCSNGMPDGREKLIMTLSAVYDAVAPCTVAFISKFQKATSSQPPLMPVIFGTGFLVTDSGIVATNRHVADAMQTLPSHPTTGEAGYAAVMFDTSIEKNTHYMRWMIVDISSVGMLSQFTSDAQWYGEQVPDIAFVQLRVRGTPFLHLADEEFYVKPGTPIATAGFPMGRDPLTMMDKVNQVTPFLRRGIVSSVFPFSIPRPHGFTIDIMQQGGSSGSPIFYDDRPTVVGMMAAGLRDSARVMIGTTPSLIPFPTNISIAVAAHMIALALPTFLQSPFAVDSSAFPTLDEWKASQQPTDQLEWETFGIGPVGQP